MEAIDPLAGMQVENFDQASILPCSTAHRSSEEHGRRILPPSVVTSLFISSTRSFFDNINSINRASPGRFTSYSFLPNLVCSRLLIEKPHTITSSLSTRITKSTFEFNFAPQDRVHDHHDSLTPPHLLNDRTLLSTYIFTFTPHQTDLPRIVYQRLDLWATSPRRITLNSHQTFKSFAQLCDLPS